MTLLDQLNQTIWGVRAKYSRLAEFDFDHEGEVIHNYSAIQWDRRKISSLTFSGIIGAIFGVMISCAVNTALVEMSVSAAFALYSGVLFVFVGLIIIWRIINSSSIPHPDESPAARTPRRYLIVFACLNIITGVCCFIFETDTLLNLSTLPRIILYSLFGMSSSFALTFGLVDLLNLLAGAYRPESARPLVESVLQIYVVIITALAMGGLFGCLFGFFEIENPDSITLFSSIFQHHQDSTVRLAHAIDPMLCIPIGIICGGLAGLANEYIRQIEISFNKLEQPVEFETDI